MTTYKAALFTPDGTEYVTDYAARTIAEVWERVDDGGSRWYFYPLRVVITDRGPTRDTQRVVDAPEMFDHLTGRTLRTAGRMIADDAEYVAAILSE